MFLVRLKSALVDLEDLLNKVNREWAYEDAIYRFYHHSIKVYRVQDLTLDIVKALQHLMPDRELNEWFMTIVQEGTGKTWDLEHSSRWLEVCRPMVEAFFHAKYFLEMAVK